MPYGGRSAPTTDSEHGARVDDRELDRLAAAFRRGDEKSFRTMVEALTRPLIALAYRYIRDWEWARDLTQETWIRVHERIGTHDPSRPFRPWLYAIHRNACLSHRRRAWVRHELVPDDEAAEALGAGVDTRNPQTELESREFHRRLMRAVDRLGESQRQVFLRVDVEGGDQKCVAEELGMKHTTLRTTLHFARKRVAEMLGEKEMSS